MLDGIRNKAQSFGVKVIFGIIIIVFVFWGVGNIGGTSGGALATVNGESITPRDFERALRMAAQAELKQTPDLLKDEVKFNQFKQMVLNNLIMSRLRLQTARRLGLMVTPHELKTQVAALPVFQDASGKFDPELYKRLLDAQGVGPGEFEAEMSEELLEDKLMRYVAFSSGVSEAEAEKQYAFTLEKRFADYVLFAPADYKTKVEISEEDISASYEADKERFRQPARAKISYLKLTPETLANGYPVSDQEAGEHYTKNIDKFKNPESFQSRHIFIPAPPEASNEPGAEQAIAKAKAAIDEIAARLKKGEDFGDLARQHSQDPESAPLGGMLAWLSAGQSGSTEFDAAALALAPGQVSEPVRSAHGFHLIRLEEKKPAHTTPLEEAKPDIIAELAREKADADFARVQKMADDALAMNTSFAELGRQLQTNAEETAFVSQEELENLMGLHSDSRQIFVDAIALASTSKEATTIPVPLNIKDGLCLVRILEARTSHIPEPADVREKIIASLQDDRARLLARKAAEEVLPSFTGKDAPDAYKDKLGQTREIIRVFPAVEPLGPAQELVDALFTSSGGWLPRVYDTPQGAVIARLARVEPVDAKEWERFKGIFIAQYRQSQENEARGAFMYNLYETAEIKVSQDVMDSIRPR